MFDKIKDYSVLYSFDQSGYERHAKRFSELNSAAFAGKQFLVTGGTRGIGLAVTKGLLNMGAKVTVTARTDKDFKINLAQRENVSFVALDLADFDQIMSINLPYIDGIVLNAGGMPDKLSVVHDEYDTIFASQVVGHFVLLQRFLNEKRLKPRSPVHWVASGGMYLQKLNLDDLAWQKTPYNKVKSYANAKRAQVILNEMLAQRYKGWIFSCSHPGWVGTDALKEALPSFQKMGNRLRTAEQGADTILWCLEQGVKLKNGQFWFDRASRNTTPFFWTKEREADRLALWNMLSRTWQDVQSSEPSAETSVN
jgi:dehydrogenase/reductase SDR family protein 12